MGLVVADGREDRHVGEEVLQHLHSSADRVEVALPRSVPDIVRHEIARPDNEVQILRETETYERTNQEVRFKCLRLTIGFCV